MLASIFETERRHKQRMAEAQAVTWAIAQTVTDVTETVVKAVSKLERWDQTLGKEKQKAAWDQIQVFPQLNSLHLIANYKYTRLKNFEMEVTNIFM